MNLTIMNSTVKQVTERIRQRSETSRGQYVEQMKQAEEAGRSRKHLSCGNLAHAFAACSQVEKKELATDSLPNIAIVSSYNDMLSAHKTYEDYPKQIRETAIRNGAVAQFAGGVPAMCDGVTQGQPGMELSLLSRDVIAMSTVVALSHNMFDAVACLGICDKIVPGLLIGALRFGHLPTVFVPGGPMTSGISNEEKAKIRRDYAQGLISREELLAGEAASYHSAGTCTFYGTANSNQMLMEIMGLHLPGSSFVNPGTALRTALTDAAVLQLIKNTQADSKVPLYAIIDEKSIVNGLVGLLATGGSTNHTLHLVAIARAAGILIDWQDFSDLSAVIPSITKVYPNGKADINHFHAAGGMAFTIRTLLKAGLLHDDVQTVAGPGLNRYTEEPVLREGKIHYQPGPEKSLDKDVLAPCDAPFDPQGGIRLIRGNLGRAVAKVSAVAVSDRVVEAPAMVFEDQGDLIKAFKEGRLNKDFIAVVRFQGPKANGMPELHNLTPTLTVLQQKGFKVALVTDGRMSGASGKVPAAIHVSPEALDGGLLPKLRDGDILRLDCESGELICLDEATVNARQPVSPPPAAKGTGREMFDKVRALITSSEEGASIL